MKIVKQKVYSFDELDQKAKDKARELYNSEGDNTPFLTDDLREYIHEELTEKGYTHDEITPLYSLSHAQGDGLMFEGTVYDKKGNTYRIKHVGGMYVHEKTADIEATDKDGNYIGSKKFEEKIYIPICKALF